ncbi:MAG: cell wall-binding repeat-containing protein [Peptococcaceae bacterium]|nr:cell wall-binding repeat-containing protein [Peptococcaceae bacterium]
MLGQNIKKDPHPFSGRPLAMVFTVIFTCTLALAFAALPAFISPQPALAADRLAGSDRYQTAVKISQAGWNESEYVILVRGDDFADALCAGPLAKSYNAPILFTGRYSLNPSTLKEIERLEAEKVIIIGGYNAISRDIDKTLGSKNIDTERIYGSDRYETSVKIAQRMGGKEAALATGEDYADALSVSAVAAAKGFCILLTQPDKLPDIVYQHLHNYKLTKTYIIGGEGAISSAIEKQVPSPVRLAGSNRYVTNCAILDYFAKDLNFDRIYAAPGEGKDNYTYALAGAALAAKTSSPLVLNGSSLPRSTVDFLPKYMTVASKVIALGGSDVVPYAVLDQYRYSHDKVIKSVFDQAGVYGPSTGSNTIAGNVAIEDTDITVQNTIIEGDLLLGEGIGDGKVELRNVTVKGKTTIRGGWDNEIVATDFTSKTLVIDTGRNKDVVRVTLEGKSSITNTLIYADAYLDDSECANQGFTTVHIISGESVILRGSYSTVSFSSAGLDLRLRSATINVLNANSRGDVWGTEKIQTANINASGVELGIIPATTKVAPGCRAYVDGERVYEGTYSAADIEKLQADPIDDLEAIAGNGEVSFTFSKPTGATKVILQQSTDKSKWTTANTGTLDKDSTSATVKGLTNGQKYYFRLVVTGGSRAGESNIVSATPSD